MKALTLWQPWASLWACPTSDKHNETRGFATQHRGPLAVHAAKLTYAQLRKMLDPYQLATLEDACELAGLPPIACLPRGAVVGVVDVAEVAAVIYTHGMHMCNRDMLMTKRAMYGVEDIPARELELGDYDTGRGTIKRYAWVASERRMLDEPIPHRGAQGLWTIPDGVL